VTPAASSTLTTASSGRTEPTITPAAFAVTPTAANLPAFACADTKGGSNTAANVTAVRPGQDNGYDRFVLQFDSTAVIPTYTVKRQNAPTFTADAGGQPITLDGNFGILVHVTPSTEHDTYTGPTDFKHPEFAVLKEARLIGDFEGNVSWGLGLSRAACMRAFTLNDPARLVIDFTTG
jgi:hypothetical protein